MRTTPIARDTARLNAEAEAAFAKGGSVWRYYRLIGVQWPTVPAAAPAVSADGLTQAIVNASGGDPSPPMLANVTLKTYVQARIQPACQITMQAAGSACRDTTPVYAAPSCMSCHASAAMTVNSTALPHGLAGKPFSADFA